MTRLLRAVLALVALLMPRVVRAQTEYFNLDAGRPTRVEDAVAAERYELELMLGALRVERLAGGVQRWRAEPKTVYGVLPFTEVELRVPLVRTVIPGPPAGTTGIAGVGIGAMHVFNLETSALPATALSAEVLLPGGSQVSAPTASYSMKALMTRTTRIARLHLNAAIGTWAVRVTPPPDTTCHLISVNGGCLDNGANGVLIPPDLPCLCGHASRIIGLSTAAAVVDTPRSTGSRWFVGVGADRSLPLRSLSIAVNLWAEKFQGLYSLSDWTAELGTRIQLSPRFVFDIGASRRFAGTIQSTAATAGLSYGLSARRLFGGRQ